MKRCIEAHRVPSFGDIPVGSLWDDDSPYVLTENVDCFEDVPTVDEPPAPRVFAARKFGQKATTEED